jgi:hypothetical protein
MRAADPPEDFPRPLNERELEVLEHLFTLDFPGRDALRAQVPHVTVVAACPCGCPTRDYAVDRDRAAAADVVAYDVANAMVESGPGVPGEVILFVRDGYLWSLELVDYSGDGAPAELPAPACLGAPDGALKPPRRHLGGAE